MTEFNLVALVGACLGGLSIVAFFFLVTMTNHQKVHQEYSKMIYEKLKDLERYYDQLNREAEYEFCDTDHCIPEEVYYTSEGPSTVIDVPNHAEEDSE